MEQETKRQQLNNDDDLLVLVTSMSLKMQTMETELDALHKKIDTILSIVKGGVKR